MNEILRNPNTPEINRAIEYHFYKFWKTCFTVDLKNIEYTESDKLFKFKTQIPFYFVNGVLNANIPQKKAEETVDKIISSFEKKKLPFCWCIGPSSKPNNLRELLIKNKPTFVQEIPGMCYRLNNLFQEEKLLQNLEIIKVRDLETLKVWNNVLLTGFEMPKHLILNLFNDIFSTLFLRDDSSAGAFLAYYKQKPVASSYVLYEFGVAGIYCVATLKEARGKGIGSALTIAPLYDAKKLGYDFAILHSTKMGLNMYKRLGFKEYLKLERFCWIY
ncbi:MAG: GNAT family N-acetyltransferase [Candidatus Lokiarchaeia archaeon]